MKIWLRFYFYKYCFPSDPTYAWLRHSLKSMLAIGLCTLIGVLKGPMVLVDLWLIFPTFMMMILVNISIPLGQRLRRILLIWVIGVATVTLMFAVGFSEAYKIMAFILIVFLGSYFGAKQVDYAPYGVIAMVYSLICVAYPMDIAELPRAEVNFLISGVVTFSVLYFIWPERLLKQILSHKNTGFFLMGRYVCFVLLDSAVGNVGESRRILLKENLLDNCKNLLKLEQSYHKHTPNDALRKQVYAYRELTYAALAIESSLQNLSNRAYFNGPNVGLQACVKSYQTLFRQLANEQFDVNDLNTVIASFDALKLNIQEQQAMIKQRVSLIYHDFLQWNDVIFKMERFNQQLCVWFNNSCDFRRSLNAS